MRLGDRRLARMVGRAVGNNPLSILVPCHRVVGKDGELTGYADGLERKQFLLRFEEPAPVAGNRLLQIVSGNGVPWRARRTSSNPTWRHRRPLQQNRTMAYDKELGDRIREQVEQEKGLTEKRMFGGLAFLINGHLAVSANSKGALMLRVDPARTDSLLQEPHVRRMVMRGRELDGWLQVEPPAFQSDDQFERWVRMGVDYARSLPPK